MNRARAEHMRKRRLSVHCTGRRRSRGLAILITVWNAHVMAMPRWGQPRLLADLHERMRDPQMPPEMVEAFRTLSATAA